MARTQADPFMIDEENPEWTAAADAEAMTFSEVFPDRFKAWKNRGGRPKVAQPKVHRGFRLAADVATAVRATGRGYNARVETALRAALERGEF